jgi:hypothetical protein
MPQEAANPTQEPLEPPPARGRGWEIVIRYPDRQTGKLTSQLVTVEPGMRKRDLLAFLGFEGDWDLRLNAYPPFGEQDDVFVAIRGASDKLEVSPAMPVAGHVAR